MTGVTVLILTIPELGGPQAVDSLDMVGPFGFCTPVEVNLVTKVVFYYTELKLRFSPKTIDYKCDKRLLSC